MENDHSVYYFTERKSQVAYYESPLNSARPEEKALETLANSQRESLTKLLNSLGHNLQSGIMADGRVVLITVAQEF